MQWWKIITVVLIMAGLGGAGWYVSRPVPGTRMTDQGREHVTPQAVFEFKYNSNPPTSGPHLPTWVKVGVFDAAQSEGELLHALEHGYVVISYNCGVHLSKISNFQFLISNVYAHEEEGSTPSADFVDPTPLRQGFEGQATGSAINDTDGCKTLVKQLTDLANKKKLWKLIVVPRPQLDTTIALTAWTYIDKFDPPAGGFDAGRIERFIDYHRDQGPEKTTE